MILDRRLSTTVIPDPRSSELAERKHDHGFRGLAGFGLRVAGGPTASANPHKTPSSRSVRADPQGDARGRYGHHAMRSQNGLTYDMTVRPATTRTYRRRINAPGFVPQPR